MGYIETSSEITVSSDYPSLLELAQVVQTLTTPPMSFEQFVELSRRFPDMRMEQETNGQVTIMPPVFFGSGNRESEANGFVWQWNRQHRLGKTLSASAGVRLRDGSVKLIRFGYLTRNWLPWMWNSWMVLFYLLNLIS